MLRILNVFLYLHHWLPPFLTPALSFTSKVLSQWCTSFALHEPMGPTAYYIYCPQTSSVFCPLKSGFLWILSPSPYTSSLPTASVTMSVMAGRLQLLYSYTWSHHVPVVHVCPSCVLFPGWDTDASGSYLLLRCLEETCWPLSFAT